MDAKPTCFVIMPIKQIGTPEHEYFKTLYQLVLQPTVAGLGYEVIRADEVYVTGAITKDIVLRLADADLVIADLTDLNPNVFYELGVRHSLRRGQTLMILDNERTRDIPFDISAYRVLQFHGNLSGLAQLRQDLVLHIGEPSLTDGTHRDNPVHDWLPALPPNALAAATGSNEGKLREQIAQLERSLRDYERRYGLPSPLGESTQRPLDVVKHWLQSVEQHSMPQEVMKNADEATRNHDGVAFLDVIRKVMEFGVRLSPSQFVELVNRANNFDMRDIAKAILDFSLDLYPENTTIRTYLLSQLAHSDDPRDTARARDGYLAELRITVDDGGVTVPDELSRGSLNSLGVMLDAYHRAGLHAEALRIAEAVKAKYPESTIAARNLARAMNRVGRRREAEGEYRRAVRCPDVDDTSAIWLGSYLHDYHRYSDAVEAYLLACILDPSDAGGFANVADDWALAIEQQAIPQLDVGGDVAFRPLPQVLPDTGPVEILYAAFSCETIDEGDREICSRAARRLGLSPEKFGASETAQHRLTRAERRDLAKRLYELFKSSVTTGNS